MPLMDINNPAVIIFLNENYEKESRLRLNWINKNRDKILEAATLTREATNYFESDVIAHSMIEGMAAITRDHIVSGLNRRTVPIRDARSMARVKDLKRGHTIADVGLGDPKEDPKLARPDTDTSLDPKMRPVDPELKKIIYKSKPEFGKDVYLEKRTKIWPEKKYYFSECSNWDYGWRMKDSEFGRKRATSYGRYWTLTRALRNRVGPQPDPPYYKSSDHPGVSKCG